MTETSRDRESKTIDAPIAPILEEQTGLKSRGQSALVDLSSYYDQELVKRFEEVFSLVRLIPWMAGSIVGTVSLGYVVWYTVFYGALSTFASTLLFIYVTISFGYLGFSLGLLLIVRRILRKLRDILEIALKMVKQVASDLQSSTEAPETSVIFNKVMHALIIPAIRAVLAAKLGFFHRPVSWTVEKVLGRAATRLLKLVGRVLKREGKSAAKGQEEPNDGELTPVSEPGRTSRALARVGRGVDSTGRFLTTAYDLVERSSNRIRFFALLPLRVIFTFFLTLAILPLLLVYWIGL